MPFQDIFDQHLQSLPQVLREGAKAVQYAKFKELIQGIVDELTDMGLSPHVLRNLATSRDCYDHVDNHTREDSHDMTELPVCPMVLVAHEVKSESGQFLSYLRVHIRPSRPLLPLKDLVGDIDTLDLAANQEEAKERNTGPAMISPNTTVGGVTFRLGMKKMDEKESVATLRRPPDPQSSDNHPATTYSDEANEVEFVVPLVKDVEFFTTLAHDLEDISSQLNNLHLGFSEPVADLAATIEKTCHPASVAADFHPYSSVSTHAGTVQVKTRYMKSDLYAWRDIFQLYVESDIFEHLHEGVKCEWSADESEARLKLFIERVARRWLPGAGYMNPRQLIRGKGLSGSKMFKCKQSVEALETFIKLNLLALEIKKFSYVIADAIASLLRTRADRSALPTPFPPRQGSPLSSSSLTVALCPSLQHSSLLAVESLILTLLKSFMNSIKEKLLPVVPSVDDYLCAICMSIAFKPIRLSCMHVFCVRCLVKMQKRGEGNCPMCRAPCVLAANSKNVDWALLNFMEDWFPAEAREKLKSNEEEVTSELMAEYRAYHLPIVCPVTSHPR